MYSVILCGGSGTRLWPLSRRNFPKQFLRLYSEYSLLQETYLRMRKLMPMERILFVTNKEGYPNVLEQIRAIDGTFDAKQVIIEPKSLNTAPAMACAIEYLLSEMGAKEDERVLFLPSDHYIGNVESYLSVLRRAFESVGDHVVGDLDAVRQAAKRRQPGAPLLARESARSGGSRRRAGDHRSPPRTATRDARRTCPRARGSSH